MRIKFSSMHKCIQFASLLNKVPFLDVYEGNMSYYGGNGDTYCVSVELRK